jgi:hypothetical protein
VRLATLTCGQAGHGCIARALWSAARRTRGSPQPRRTEVGANTKAGPQCRESED